MVWLCGELSQGCEQPAAFATLWTMPTRRARSPIIEEEAALLGGTRGGAKDASERVKAQAIIIFWKKVALLLVSVLRGGSPGARFA